MQPTEKDPQIDGFLSRFTGLHRYLAILENICVACDSKDNTQESFRDDLSIKEYQISGLCQSCQDKIWGPNNEEF